MTSIDKPMTLRELLQGLQSQIPESLLAGSGWDRLLFRVGELPAAAAFDGFCGFELDLGNPEPEADFALVVTPGSVAQYFIDNCGTSASTLTEACLGAYLAKSPERNHGLILAYDIAGVPDERLQDLMVYLRFESLFSSEDGRAAFDPVRLAETLGQFMGQSDVLLERRALSRAFEALPSCAAVVFAAATPARTPRSARMVVADLSASNVAQYLERLKWPGSIPFVLQFLSGIEDLSERFMVAFDVTPNGILPRLGFEMYPNSIKVHDYRALLRSWLTTTRIDWAAMIERLGDMGLCLPVKARGLLNWPKRCDIYGEHEAFFLHMGINHIKFVINADCLQAKAYAGLKAHHLTPESS